MGGSDTVITCLYLMAVKKLRETCVRPSETLKK